MTKCRLDRRNQELQQTLENRAREIQQALLPKEIPQIEGFEVARTWEPARIVGGDYFDVIRLGQRKLGICIADVVGKSVPAALLMANVQATVRAFASESASPSWLCSRVNSVLCANIASEKFVTLFYGVLDAERNTLQYTSAGHPRPILKSASGAVRQLENGGGVLGVFPDWKYEDSVVQLAPGDRLVLFTDGITEAAKQDGEQFGEEGLIRLLKTLADEPPSKLNARLPTEVKNLCDAHLQDDAIHFVEEIHRLTSEGVDVVFDGIGGPHMWRSRKALRPGGKVVVYGLTSSLSGGRLASGRRHRFHGIAIFALYIAGGWLLPGRKRVIPYSIQWLKRLRPALFRPVGPPSKEKDQAADRAAISPCRGKTRARVAREGRRDGQDRARAQRAIGPTKAECYSRLVEQPGRIRRG